MLLNFVYIDPDDDLAQTSKKPLPRPIMTIFNGTYVSPAFNMKYCQCVVVYNDVSKTDYMEKKYWYFIFIDDQIMGLYFIHLSLQRLYDVDFCFAVLVVNYLPILYPFIITHCMSFI